MPDTIGHHTHQYKVIWDWGLLDKGRYPVGDCHEMVMDAKSRIILLTNDVRNNILIYDRSGVLLDSWGTAFPGGHGLSIHNENGVEFLYVCDYSRHQVIKTTLSGREIMVIDYPREIAAYKSAEQFKPTETAIAPNGDIYITDGYGLQYVIQYNGKGKYIRHWGGLGNGDAEFDCVHGIAIDNRDPSPSLLITSRNHNAFKRFTMEGDYMETISMPGSFVCRPVIKNDNVYAAVFRSGQKDHEASGYITILNRDNKVISTPGGSEPEYINNKLKPQGQASGIFIHPHDVCVDNDENVYVCQWKSNNSYPIKLERI